MTTQEVAISRVLKAIQAIKEGGMVIMVDDEDRENEGDLVFAADHVTPQKINFMTKEARGLICLSLDGTIIDRLKLPMMADSTKQSASRSTAFTVSIEARHGVSTGISAADRAHTIAVAVDERTTPDDLVVPGHIFPLKARAGGVLERAGHTEGSVDLARLADLKPAAVICEIMNDDGTMARMSDLTQFSEKHAIPIVSIADLITFRLLRESLIETIEKRRIATPTGEYDGYLFRSRIDGMTHFALVKDEAGSGFGDGVVDVRVHRQRPLVDVFGDDNRIGKSRVTYGLELLKNSSAAVFLYLTHPDSQSSLALEMDELSATPQQTQKSWSPMDPRMLGVGAQILRTLGVRRMRVHMSNPTPLIGLPGFDLEVVDTHHITADGGLS